MVTRGSDSAIRVNEHSRRSVRGVRVVFRHEWAIIQSPFAARLLEDSCAGMRIVAFCEYLFHQKRIIGDSFIIGWACLLVWPVAVSRHAPCVFAVSPCVQKGVNLLCAQFGDFGVACADRRTSVVYACDDGVPMPASPGKGQ